MSANSPPDAGTAPEESPLGRLEVGFVLLVGLSGGTMAVQGDGSLLTVVVATAGGTLFGAGLLWYLRRTARELRTMSRR